MPTASHGIDQDTFNSLTDPDVRSLAWCLMSPVLFRVPAATLPGIRFTGDTLESMCNWIHKLDRDPLELQIFLDLETDHRLGARFERLIEFWFSRSPLFELLHRRLQWGDEQQTKGEFDFLVNNVATGITEHWEVAAKFYLGVPGGTGCAANELTWIGPGRRDSLKRKLGHLDDKQIVQGMRKHAARCLQQRGIHEVQSRAFVKGRLFYPATMPEAGKTSWCSGAHVNSQHERGLWCDWEFFNSLEGLRYFVLSKRQWLDPCPDPDAEEMASTDEIQSYLQTGPVCIEAFKGTQRQRYFVVPQGWFDALPSQMLSTN